MSIILKCTAYGNPPPGKLKGYDDGKWMRIFSGYVLSTWIRKHKGGYASMAITAMGEMGKLASSTSYVNTITTGTEVSKVGISRPVIMATAGQQAGVVQTVCSDINKTLPADDIGKALLFMLRQMTTESKIRIRSVPELNNAANTAITRLETVAAFSILAGGSAKNLGTGENVIEFNRQLQWSVARHFADMLYAGWAHGMTDGGGDLWTVTQGLLRSFLLSVIPTARSKDFIVPMFYGLNLPEFRAIDPNEYWAVETGKTFTPKDFSYVGEVLLFSPRGDPVTIPNDAGRGTGFTLPLLGSAKTNARGGVTGRLQVTECPAWAVPPANLVPEVVSKNSDIPEMGSPDDPNVKIERPAAEFWYDSRLGDQVANWTLGFLEYVHRVISITGRLRFDIAPGSLIKVTFTEDLYTRQSVPKYDMYGYVAEVRTSIGSRGRGTSASTVLTLSHVHNDNEHNHPEKAGWPSANTVHPVYGVSWTGTHLVDGADK
jgi:hypothetical protein